MRTRTYIRFTLLAALAAAPARLDAQNGPLAINTAVSEEGGSSARGAVDLASTALARGRYAVLIDLDENRLYFRKGDLTLWSAPIGTGTGLRLETEQQAWDFSTPNGVFQVKMKEENPVWIAPDWYFVENGLPVPAANDKKRYFPGGLGAAAVYIDRELAIHGTDKPDLLGQRVSHGCIRLSNRDALRLYHNVQVGTEVIIVGGKSAPVEVAAQPKKQGGKSTFNPAAAKPAPKDEVLAGWKNMSTEDLLAVLDNELWLDTEVTRWPEVASLLLDRGLRDRDDAALKGLFLAAENVPNARVEREYATFLADAYSRSALRTAAVLSDLSRQARERAATAIVQATMELYNGDLDEPSAPWPTRRLPKTVLESEPQAELGWHSLSRAEADLRTGGGWRSL